jgi:hypothetical protein
MGAKKIRADSRHSRSKAMINWYPGMRAVSDW